ncbi:MAG: site-specific DNA-methyltransferase [Candidatus Kapaibacterium sp.]|jgi:adenine-specific DNA-methyltransferase
MNDKNKEQELPLGLYWKGKRTTVDRIVLPFQSLEVVETINESRATRKKEKGTLYRQDPNALDTSWRNKLIWGDNKYVMSALLEQYAGKIDLIYIDPPFATGANFSTSVEIGDDEIEVTKEASAIEELAYRDTWGKGLDSFLQMMYDRLVLMRELLSEKGTIYVHVDYHVGHYAKIILDEIFGYENFRNEIVWRRMTPSGFKGKYDIGNSHDVIFRYSKSNNYLYNPIKIAYSEEYIKERFSKVDENGKRFKDEKIGTATTKATIEKLKKEGRIYVTSNGTLRIKHFLDDAEGYALDDVWTDLPTVNSQAVERVDYPTQKPEALLERIMKASSNEGDLVADFFGGSGTTAAVAEKLGRRWITSDLGRYAIHTARKRFLEIEGCKPFEILNIGKYERQYWQTIQFGNKTAEQSMAEYIAFVLKLYKAEALPGSAYIHGKKGNKLVHIGGVDAPVTFSDIQYALEDTRRMKQKELVVLGWEWEMGLHDVVEQEAEKAGIKLHLLSIPREAMDKRAVDAGDIQFFELAYLETEVNKSADGYQVKLTDFVIPNLDLIPAEVKKLIKKWSDYIDYWSVDWDYKDDTFHNQWQSYRTKKDRSLDLITDPHEYAKKGDYKVMVKVIDIFGNDTTHIIELKHR